MIPQKTASVALALVCAIAIGGCGAGLVGLENTANSSGNSGNGGGTSIPLLSIYYGSTTASNWSDSINSSQSTYAAITFGWSSGPTLDTNDVAAINGGGGPILPITFTAPDSSSFARVDFVFDAGGNTSPSVNSIAYIVDAVGGCSTQSPGVVGSTPSLGSGGTWDIGWWNSSINSWSFNAALANVSTPYVLSNGNGSPFPSSSLALSGLGGSGNYIIISVRATESGCGVASGIDVRSVVVNVN